MNSFSREVGNLCLLCEVRRCIHVSVGVRSDGKILDADDEEDEEEEKSYVFNPLWLLGFVLVVAGSIADFGALSFASQIIVAPLGSFTLVTNIFFAPYFSGEVLTRQDVISTATIVFG